MIEKTILDSGLVVISDYIPAFPSFALSYSVRGGSRAENEKNNGIHHFIEHMMFKGSSKYDLKQIADISDRLGGRLNAFTGKEITQYYLKAIDEKLDESFELLTDIVMNSTFPQDEFLKEKSVVVQEIKEAEDSPETNAFETLYESIYETNGLGYPIGGKEKSVSSFERDRIYDFYKKNYSPDNLLLTAVGNIKHDQLVRLAERFFKKYPSKAPGDFSFPLPAFHAKTFSKKNDSLNQVYAITGFESLSAVSPLRNRFALMNDIVGGGMSSRLFQTIREEKGLAYTVSSFSDNYLDCGVHLIYSIVDKEKTGEYLDAVKEEILHLKKEGITRDELNRSRDHMKASVILGLESTLSLMRFHVNNELNMNQELTIEEIVDDINNATVNDINALFQDYLNLDKESVFLYGDV
ncbi:MAG: insulinase family protein [bacterium]|nr:insulinase family protein [bacterium]